MFLFKGLFVGIIATAIFDLYQLSLFYGYNINKSRWNLIGRYFIGLKDKKYYREDITNDDNYKYELLIGYLVHYAIGSIFGITYVILNILIFNQPSLMLAIIFGFLTVLGAWCITMPYAFNMGFFASKKEEQK